VDDPHNVNGLACSSRAWRAAGRAATPSGEHLQKGHGVMNARTITVALVLMVLSAFSANAKEVYANTSTDINTLLRLYDLAPSNDREQIELVAVNIQWGMLLANLDMQRLHEQPIYCQPDELLLSGAMLMTILRGAIQKHPLLGTAPLGIGILSVLVTTFPCPHSK
jgi:hypothetical protein